MLRRTLRCLFEQEGPFTLGRAVMAKARPVHTSPSTRKGTPLLHHGDLAEPTHDSAAGADVSAALAASSPPPPAAALQSSKEQQHGDVSEDAYRFLLHHIDSEIVALKRRITTVAKQREAVENNQTRRIRELFECMERPWLMLESIPVPQLPNRALEVYAKELYIKRHGPDAGSFEQDAVFLDACRRNWRGLPLEQRKPYEVAARRNEHMRRELKKKLSNGCSFFEGFCEQLRECTAETARNEKMMRPLDAGQATPPRGNASATRKKAQPLAKMTHTAVAPAPAEVADSARKRGSRAAKKRGSRHARRAPTCKKTAVGNAAAPTRAAAAQRAQTLRRQRPKLNRVPRAMAHALKRSAAKRKRSHAR
ncbi:hypothetical protein TraAM80_05345 [Trypanosoma rangeli]|uniref:Uncharacterized protein n=1 Tax=Trypanosoma rangeli TaxID=5698 RepID=A0A3R7MKF0_TRYRA|nr:uncharacterized protein TraAM80_05345 [Trypanosoma rangeli]RNF04110.1 hypothetical protein TraAM80_05345 [Trypanosoma rangeli]|eukprot:RNF04110.1 hypothetical protein TraAM80_05345 [Trypanosoma rangeli]